MRATYGVVQQSHRLWAGKTMWSGRDWAGQIGDNSLVCQPLRHLPAYPAEIVASLSGRRRDRLGEPKLRPHHTRCNAFRLGRIRDHHSGDLPPLRAYRWVRDDGARQEDCRSNGKRPNGALLGRYVMLGTCDYSSSSPRRTKTSWALVAIRPAPTCLPSSLPGSESGIQRFNQGMG